jgi:hypothetical protein
MRKSLIFLGLTAALISCAKEEKAGLSQSEYDRLVKINRAQHENFEAMNSASFQALDDNSQKLGKMISDKCTAGGEKYNPVFDRNYDQSRTFSGQNCPIQYAQMNSYKMNEKTWTISENWSSQSEDYKRLNPILTRALHGSIKVMREDLLDKVSGSLVLDSMATSEFGIITGSIVTEQKYTGNEGRGSITLSIQSHYGWKHKAEIVWDTQNSSSRYAVDGVETDRKTFADLFSAFGLSEIVTNTDKMR